MNIVIVGGTSGIGGALSKSLSLKNNIFIGSRNQDNISDYIKSVGMTSSIENIFDIHYRTYSSGISAPGRNVNIGLNFKF